MKHIYEKYRDGVKLTDQEVLEGMQAYKQAADSLVVLGLAFNVTFKECNLVYHRLQDMAAARGLLA